SRILILTSPVPSVVYGHRNNDFRSLSWLRIYLNRSSEGSHPFTYTEQTQTPISLPREHRGGIETDPIIADRTRDRLLFASDSDGHALGLRVFGRVRKGLLSGAIKRGLYRRREPAAALAFDRDRNAGTLRDPLGQKFQGGQKSEIV